MQQIDNKWCLIHCGSRFITPAEARYAMTELELLAAVWAMSKMRFYLIGRPSFHLLTDHEPLAAILNSKDMVSMTNPRLFRL